MITCIVTDLKGRPWRRRTFASWEDALEWVYFGRKLKSVVEDVVEAFT